MTDAECAETLSEFRKLTLGPELSAALDHAIALLRARAFTFESAREQAERLRAHGGSIPGGARDGVLMNSRAIDLAMA